MTVLIKEKEAMKPTNAFVVTSWASLGIAASAFLIGLWNANFQLNEKGFYLTVFLFGLFSVITLQKTVRDELEGIFVTKAYKTLNIACVVAPILLMIIGLFNVQTLELNEKGFFAISFAMTLFASIVVQKNIRDLAMFQPLDPGEKIQVLSKFDKNENLEKSENK